MRGMIYSVVCRHHGTRKHQHVDAIHEALLGDGILDVKGHCCDYNGQDSPYFVAAIKAVEVSANLDILKYVSSPDSF